MCVQVRGVVTFATRVGNKCEVCFVDLCQKSGRCDWLLAAVTHVRISIRFILEQERLRSDAKSIWNLKVRKKCIKYICIVIVFFNLVFNIISIKTQVYIVSGKMNEIMVIKCVRVCVRRNKKRKSVAMNCKN